MVGRGKLESTGVNVSASCFLGGKAGVSYHCLVYGKISFSSG